jgi:HAD superfamily hydrolase (TIGR01509 family)
VPRNFSVADARLAGATVVFDFEGTLVDFQWRLEPAAVELRRAFGTFGLRGGVFDDGHYATMWNAAADLLLSQGRLPELRQALYPIYDRWDEDALARWAPRPGAAELLGELAGRGARLAMVSNIGRAALGAALERFDFARWLSPVVSRDEVNTMKPGPEGILRVLKALQVEPGDALFVGDSRADVFGARAAGMPVAIIKGGECGEWSGPAFSDARPDYLISRLDEIDGVLASRL